MQVTRPFGGGSEECRLHRRRSVVMGGRKNGSFAIYYSCSVLMQALRVEFIGKFTIYQLLQGFINCRILYLIFQPDTDDKRKT